MNKFTRIAQLQKQPWEMTYEEAKNWITNGKKIIDMSDVDITEASRKFIKIAQINEDEVPPNAWRERYNYLINERDALIKKHPSFGLTREEAAVYKVLSAEIDSIRFDHYPPLNISKIKPLEERASTLIPDIVLTANKDLLRRKPIYTALSEASAGVYLNSDTVIDDIMNGKSKTITPEELYGVFDATRESMRKHYGDTITLYRAKGMQKSKATTNWSTTLEGAKKYPGEIITANIPIDNIIAVNVGLNGFYHEIIVGQKPTDNNSMGETLL